MDWIQWICTIGLLGALGYWIHLDTAKKIANMKKEAQLQADKTDHLYETFISLLKKLKF
jgi:hypothetical protein